MKQKNGMYLEVKNNKKVKIGRIEKMSKSKKNVVDPQQIIENFGADTARFFMLSDSPPNRDMEWSDSGVEGSWRFLNKLWKFVKGLPKNNYDDKLPLNLSKEHKELLKILNASIIEVTKAIDEFHFNIAVASVRSLFNSISNYEIKDEIDTLVIIYVTKKFLILINPMVPHLAEELWHSIGHLTLLADQPWPKYEETLFETGEVTIAVQVNGKMRATITYPKDADKATIEKIALSAENVIRFTEGQQIRK